MEVAARRRRGGAGRLAGGGGAAAEAVGGIGFRRGLEQRLGVGMQRVADDLAGWACLHYAPEVHDGDAMGEVIRGGDVVGDVEECSAALLLEVPEQIEDFGPVRGIDHRDRLVGDDQLGLEHQSPGNDDPLALPAG